MSDRRPEVAVLVVDDHEPFRDAARSVVGDLPGFRIVAEAASGEDALVLAAAHRPTLVLMDIHLPGIDGIEATVRLLGGDGRPTVFLLSTYAEQDLPAGARTCGAAAYVRKEDISPALLRRLWDGRESGQRAP